MSSFAIEHTLRLFSNATAVKHFGDREAEASKNLDTAVFKRVLALIADHVVKTFNEKITVIETRAAAEIIMNTEAFSILKNCPDAMAKFIRGRFAFEEEAAELKLALTAKVGVTTSDGLYELMRQHKMNSTVVNLAINMLAEQGSDSCSARSQELKDQMILSESTVRIINIVQLVRSKPPSFIEEGSKSASWVCEFVLSKEVVPIVKLVIEQIRNKTQHEYMEFMKLLGLAAAAVIDLGFNCLVKEAQYVSDHLPPGLDDLIDQEASEALRSKIFESTLMAETSDRTAEVESKFKKLEKLATNIGEVCPGVISQYEKMKAKFEALHQPGKQFAAVVRALHLIFYVLPGIPEKAKRSPQVRGSTLEQTKSRLDPPVSSNNSTNPNSPSGTGKLF